MLESNTPAQQNSVWTFAVHKTAFGFLQQEVPASYNCSWTENPERVPHQDLN